MPLCFASICLEDKINQTKGVKMKTYTVTNNVIVKGNMELATVEVKILPGLTPHGRNYHAVELLGTFGYLTKGDTMVVHRDKICPMLKG